MLKSKESKFMKKILSLLGILVFLIHPLWGQLYHEYKLPKQIEQESNHTDKMTYYSFIGEYQKALEIDDLEEDTILTISKEDSLYFTQFKAQAALPFLINQAKKEQIFIIK